MGIDLMKGDKLLTVATPGEGQKNAQRFIASALVGPTAAGAFVVDEVPDPNFEDVTINQENMCIQGGQTPQAFGSQPHEKHLLGGATQGHLPLLGEVEQLMNQMLEVGLEQNVEAADKLLRSLLSGIEHAAQHVQFLSEYKRGGKGKALFEEQVKELNKVINDFAQFGQSFGEALEQAQQAANPQAGMDPKMVETQAKIQRDDMLAQAKVERDNQVTMAKLEQGEVKAAVKAEQSMGAHETKLAQQVQQAQVKQMEQAAKVEQELAAQAARDTMEIGKSAVMARIEVEKAKEKPAGGTEK
jgi:sRNA-binding carbon storage regulator CsrA